MVNEIINGNIHIDGEPIPIETVTCLELIDPGANAVVARAIDKTLGREVLVKVWTDRPGDRRDKVQQGYAEAQKIAGLNHPNIATIYTAGECAGKFYVIMEYIKGSTLRKWLEDAPDFLSRFEVWRLINDALDYAHRNGVFHGDLHSNNILVVWKEFSAVSGTWHPMVLDFGTSIFAQDVHLSKDRETNGLMELTKDLLIEFDITTAVKIGLAELPDEETFGSIRMLGEAAFGFHKLVIAAANEDGYNLRGSSVSVGIDIARFPVFDIDQVADMVSDISTDPQVTHYFWSGIFASSFMGLQGVMNAPPFKGSFSEARQMYLDLQSKRYLEN